MLPVLAGILVGFATFASSGAQAAAPAQRFGLVLHREAAATERLPYYRAAAPIIVRVGGDTAHLPALRLTAHGPGGEAVTAALARRGDSFSGNVLLLAPGAWTLAFSTQLGTALASVPLVVIDEDAADFAARCAFALSALSIVAGGLLIAGTARRPRALRYVRRRS